MKPIDTLLWPIVSRTWSYTALVAAMALLMILSLGASLSMEPCGGFLVVTLGLSAVEIAMWAALTSRERSVRWRTLSLSRRVR